MSEKLFEISNTIAAGMKVIILCLCYFCFHNVCAQQNPGTRQQLSASESLFLNHGGLEDSKDNMEKIFITQIGDYNRADAKISEVGNKVLLKQGGSTNTIELYARVKQLEGEIVQQGDNNYVLDFFNDPLLEIPLDVRQNGNNLHFERHGTNSIGSGLKIEMNGSSRSVIVRNFK